MKVAYLALPHWKNHVLVTGPKALIISTCISGKKLLALDVSLVASDVELLSFSEGVSIFRPRKHMVDSGSAKTSIPTKEAEWLTSVVLSSNMT